MKNSKVISEPFINTEMMVYCILNIIKICTMLRQYCFSTHECAKTTSDEEWNSHESLWDITAKSSVCVWEIACGVSLCFRINNSYVPWSTQRSLCKTPPGGHEKFTLLIYVKHKRTTRRVQTMNDGWFLKFRDKVCNLGFTRTSA